MIKKKKGYYSISIVSNILGIHQQTIRMYEREGLINPTRTEGNTRMFSEEDIAQLEQIINYTTKLGVNLAGVQIILKMEKKITKLQSEINRAFEKSKHDLEEARNEYTMESKNIGEELKKIKTKRLTIKELKHHNDNEGKILWKKKKKI